VKAEYAALQRTTLAQFPEVLPEDVVTFEAFRYGRACANHKLPHFFNRFRE
jgi:hypothetical protein